MSEEYTPEIIVETVNTVEPEILDTGKPLVIKKERYHKVQAPIKKETKRYLENWKVPNHAYILLEVPKVHITGKGEKHIGTGLYTMNVQARPRQANRLAEIIKNKKARVIDYGNFPTLDSKDAAKRQLARLHRNELGECDWAILEKDVVGYLNANKENNKFRRDLESKFMANEVALQKKIADLTAKAAKSKSKSTKARASVN